MKALQFSVSRTGFKIVHTNSEGNRHASCGIVVSKVLDAEESAQRIMGGGARLCKNCLRVKPARDLSAPVVRDEPTDVWSVIDRAGNEVTRVYGKTLADARNEAERVDYVREVRYAEGGYVLRCLTRSQLESTASAN